MKRFVIAVSVVLGLLLATAVTVFFGLGFFLSPQGKLVESDVIVAISGGDTTSRATEAAELYHEGWAPHIIFSGDALDPSGPSNARFMANLAQSQGVPASAITLEEDSVNTRDNADKVAEIFSSQPYNSVILVTSPYHQRRASILFKRALGPNVTVINHSSVDGDWRRSSWWSSSYSRQLTLSELQKSIYEWASQP